jgi:DNA invertase Pin-like site-specific DNA recombinase
MNVGYARTSTAEQQAGLEAQLAALRAQGIRKIFSEQTSSVDRDSEQRQRHQLDAALEYIRDGDVLVVTKLDRLARSVSDLLSIIRRIEAKEATLKILDMNLDTTTPTGKLMLNLLGSIAQFERELMLERQREGIARAKRDGKYRGRKPTARAKANEIIALRAQGVGASEIARRLSIARSSVHGILKAAA